MHNSFFQAICRVGMFMICAQAMIHFRPQEAYEKYLKLLVSVMVLIQLFMPLGSFLLGGGGQEAADLLAQFKQELEQGMDTARESAEKADALLQEMTLEEVRRRIEEQEENRKAQEGENMGMETDGQGAAEGDNGRVQDNREYSQEAGGIEVEIKPVEPVKVGKED